MQSLCAEVELIISTDSNKLREPGLYQLSALAGGGRAEVSPALKPLGPSTQFTQCSDTSIFASQQTP